MYYGTTTAYGPTSASQDIGAGNTAAPVGVQLSGLASDATYHAQLVVTNADGTSRSADLVFTTPANRALKPVAPSLSQIRQSSRRWVEGNKRASISVRHTLPVGTKFSFELNETATVKFVFTQTLAGRTVDRHCVARTRRNAHNPRCTMSVIGGTLAFNAHAGVDKVQFAGTSAPTPQAQAGRVHPGDHRYRHGRAAIRPRPADVHDPQTAGVSPARLQRATRRSLTYAKHDLDRVPPDRGRWQRESGSGSPECSNSSEATTTGRSSAWPAESDAALTSGLPTLLEPRGHTPALGRSSALQRGAEFHEVQRCELGAATVRGDRHGGRSGAPNRGVCCGCWSGWACVGAAASTVGDPVHRVGAAIPDAFRRRAGQA